MNSLKEQKISAMIAVAPSASVATMKPMIEQSLWRALVSKEQDEIDLYSVALRAIIKREQWTL